MAIFIYNQNKILKPIMKKVLKSKGMRHFTDNL